jgi:uncharacterized membrane protein YkoI
MVQNKGGSMNDKLKRGLLTVAALAALAGGGAAIAGASGSNNSNPAPGNAPHESATDDANGSDEADGRDDGNGHPITGSKFASASAVALKAAGGGQVTGSEKHDEEGFYEIEVTRSDGTQVDVHLDKNLNVLDASPDGSGEG